MIHLPRSSSTSFPRHPFPPLLPPRPTLHTTQTRRSSQLPRVTQRLFLPTGAPLPSFPSIYQGSKELGSELGRMSRDHGPSRRSSSLLFELSFGGIDFVIVVETVSPVVVVSKKIGGSLVSIARSIDVAKVSLYDSS